MKRWAAFLDRDGTLVEEVGHLLRADDMRILPRAVEAVKRLSEAGGVVVVATNQPAVARGLLDEATLRRIHQHMSDLFAARGARFDAILYCPHHPEKQHGGNLPYRIECECRKPKPGMLLEAAKRFGIDIKSSFMVGDTTRDVQTARNAGCGAILVETGYAGRDGAFNVRPDIVCADVGVAAEWILSRVGRA